MKLKSSLLQAITLGVSITAVAASATSCQKEKIKIKSKLEQVTKAGEEPTRPAAECPACGMG